MPACLDLEKVHLRRQHGDLLAVYTWMDGERALFIIPAHRSPAPWFVVMESAAYLYDDPHYMARMCPQAARHLGLADDKPTWARLATIINEGLPDLIQMPSEPDWEARKKTAAMGVMSVRAEGEVVHQEDLVMPQELGAAYVTA